MNKILFTMLIIFSFSISARLSPLFAQEKTETLSAPAPMNETMKESMNDLNDVSENTAEEADLGKDEDFAFGTVVSVGDNSLTILEYNFDTEQEVQMTYEANAETKYENVAALKELMANDEVEVNYKEQDGKKVATFISKDLPVEDDTYSEEMPNNATVTDNNEEAAQLMLNSTSGPTQ